MLTVLIALPLAGAAAVVLTDARRPGAARTIGLAAAAAAFLVAVRVWIAFHSGQPGLQFEERAAWIAAAGITYHLGVDGLSVSLTALVTLLVPLALLASAEQVGERTKGFVLTMLLLEAGLLGTFLAQDLVLFYVFWEAMLIPMYFLIALWGGPARRAAAIKFLLYTMTGSVLMLLAIVAVYLQGGRVLGTPTFDLPALLARPLGWTPGVEGVLFGAFAAAFAIKMPVWPLHTWLPDAYAEAPPAVTVLLAGLMAKAGAYGLLRFGLPLFPEAVRAWGPLLAALAVVGILYGGAVAWAQGDLRRLLAYGSLSHMGFILLGISALDVPAVQGSVLQMINHGVSTGALFVLAGMLIARTGKTRTDAYGGLASAAPALAAFTLIVVVSSLALPGTNGFVGEFLILLGTYETRPVYAVLAAVGVVVAAAYLLAFVGRIFHGPLRADLRGVADLRPRDYAVLAPLVAMIFWVGWMPGPLLGRSEATVRELLRAPAVVAGLAATAAVPAHRPPESDSRAAAVRAGSRLRPERRP
ncbi:MAG TPA: NADH-quinone oxidoreductase subunit M [bacterium]|nr:NADH-quinone oxidoreductase subunit M [bacterium]